jgi:hypothetical protein
MPAIMALAFFFWSQVVGLTIMSSRPTLGIAASELSMPRVAFTREQDLAGMKSAPIWS